jgi:hypothetical protein
VVPESTYHVPDQWVTEHCFNTYGVCPPTDPVFVPGYDVVVAGYTVPGSPSGSNANSGDPFTIDFQGNPNFGSNGAGGPPGSGPNVVLSNVPEPDTAALMLGGLIGIGALLRRRRVPADKRLC